MRLLLLVLPLLTAACTVTPARVSVRPIEITPIGVEVEHGERGTFCPPGQAKKGNC